MIDKALIENDIDEEKLNIVIENYKLLYEEMKDKMTKDEIFLYFRNDKFSLKIMTIKFIDKIQVDIVEKLDIKNLFENLEKLIIYNSNNNIVLDES